MATGDKKGALMQQDVGAAGGVAPLGGDKKVPAENLPEMDYEKSGSVKTHDEATDAHSALFAEKADLDDGSTVAFSVGYDAGGLYVVTE